MRKLSYACISNIWLTLVFASLSIAQEKTRYVEPPRERYKNQPIEIVGWEVKDRVFIDKNRVVADEDWLKDLTLSVKNVSERNIRLFNIDLLIKKRGLTALGIPINFQTHIDPVMASSLTETSSLTEKGEKKLGFLMPGETVKVKVSDDVMSFFGKERVKRGIEDIDHIAIDIRAIYFEDGNIWMFGVETRPDPNDPEKRIRVDKPEFFGLEMH